MDGGWIGTIPVSKFYTDVDFTLTKSAAVAPPTPQTAKLAAHGLPTCYEPTQVPSVLGSSKHEAFKRTLRGAVYSGVGRYRTRDIAVFDDGGNVWW